MSCAEGIYCLGQTDALDFIALGGYGWDLILGRLGRTGVYRICMNRPVPGRIESTAIYFGYCYTHNANGCDECGCSSRYPCSSCHRGWWNCPDSALSNLTTPPLSLPAHHHKNCVIETLQEAESRHGRPVSRNLNSNIGRKKHFPFYTVDLFFLLTPFRFPFFYLPLFLEGFLVRLGWVEGEKEHSKRPRHHLYTLTMSTITYHMHILIILIN